MSRDVVCIFEEELEIVLYRFFKEKGNDFYFNCLGKFLDEGLGILISWFDSFGIFIGRNVYKKLRRMS